MKTISLNTKISDAIEWLNESCLTLRGGKFNDFGHYHSLIRNCVNNTITFTDGIELKTWAVSFNYDFDLFNYSRNIIEDKRSKYNIKGKIVQVDFSMSDTQYNSITEKNEPIYLNNPILINDLLIAHKIFLLKKNISSNIDCVNSKKEDILRIEKANEILVTELNSLL